MGMYISGDIFTKMEDDAHFLSNLFAAGVEAWEGYDESREMNAYDEISETGLLSEFANLDDALNVAHDAKEIKDLVEFLELANSQAMLQSFEAYGVDCWRGYGIAQDM